MRPSLHALAPCLGGVVPPALATVDADGTPNIVRLSTTRVLDDRHLAVTRQFFGKTVTNLERNPRAALIVADPATYRGYVLDLRFLRSETSGPLFEALRAELDALAALMGMSDVFTLRAADVFELLEVHPQPWPEP